MTKPLSIQKSGKIYLQIYLQLKEQIEKEELKGKLPPIRKLAEKLNISPSTVVKAYDELEKIIMWKKRGKWCIHKIREKEKCIS